MNSTVISLLFDSIEWFICNPRPQYLPKNERKTDVCCDPHEVNVENRVRVIYQMAS